MINKVALYLFKRLCRFNIPWLGKTNVESDLYSLYPGEQMNLMEQDYYVKKLNLIIKIIILGFFIGLVVKLASYNEANLSNGVITRQDFKEGSRQLHLQADMTDSSEKYVIEMMPKTLSDFEVQGMLDEFAKQIDRFVLGENTDLKHVFSDLDLRESYDSFPFEVEWISSEPLILSNSGKVYEVDTPTPVKLTISVSYQDCRYSCDTSVMVIPPVLTEEEKTRKEIQDYLSDTEFAQRNEQVLTLPKVWKGKEIHWSYVAEDYSLFIWLMTPVISLLVYIFTDKDLHGQVENKRKGLEHDYSDIVHKIVLYTGAGMTVRSAIQKIGTEYEKRGTEKRYGYEEILYTCRELQAGVSEGTAYERLGKRTGVKDYIKLSSLLMQNLKRGNSRLQERLTEEAFHAVESRLTQVRKSGEESGTKLLLPMVLMLGVTMILILIPAFGVM